MKNCYKYYCALLLLLVSVAFADQIILDEPPASGIFHVDAPMDIRYRIRYNGMAAIGSTAVSLANAETRDIVAVFPNATWIRSDTNEDRSVADLWHIPRSLNNGTYILRVAGP
ncbi:hypothetical protein BJV82DRAFT_137846 [Fennellomyces sp. T-0311]|nr:hypothetical protein BJV82DRAFT_137846 [Fennellomyces sp. T-0311]